MLASLLLRHARGARLSDLLWVADASRAGELEWASVGDPTVASGSGTALTSANFPTARIAQQALSGVPTYHFTMLSADRDLANHPDGSAQRTELGMANPSRADLIDRLFLAGDERWLGYRVRLGSTFPITNYATSTPPYNPWQLVLQLKQQGSFGSPIQALEVKDGQWKYQRDWGDTRVAPPTGFRYSWNLAPVQRDVWVKFLWHVRFDSDPARGFVEIFGDLADGQGLRLLLPLQYQATMKISDGSNGFASGSTVPCHLRAGIYRNSVLAQDDEIWYAGIACCRTRAAAIVKAGL